MRIITGTARGCRLAAPEGTDTRPTADRVKEAEFSIIQFEIRGRKVLDLFAGSGQLALEALSRGAASAVLADSSPEAVRVIRANAEKTGLSDRCRILRGGVPGVLESLRGERFGLVFADPPYASGLLPATLEALLGGGLVGPESIVVCESGRPDDVFLGRAGLAERFEIIRQNRYGAAAVTVLRPSGKADTQ